MEIKWAFYVFLQGSEVSHFVLIAGEPIKEPVVQHGMSRLLDNICY